MNRKVLALLLCSSMLLLSFTSCKKPTTTNVSSMEENSEISLSESSENFVDSNNDNNSNIESGISIGSSDVLSNDSKSSTANNSNSTPVKITNPYGVNLGGKTITIACLASDQNFNKKKGLSIYLDAVAARTTLIETKLNCKISLKTVATMEALQDAAFTTIMSGEKYADILLTNIHRMPGYLSSELLADLNTIPSIDLTQSYANGAGIKEATTLGKKTFCIAPLDSFALSAMGIFFNKRIINELKLENPYQLVKDGKWTLSKMRTMMKTATRDTDGKTGMTKDDQWGLIQLGPAWEGADSILTACNAPLLKTDGNGNISYNVDSSPVIDAINLANQMFFKDQTTYTDVNDAIADQMFMAKKSLFLCVYANHAQSLADMDDDFGFVPFPKGDNASTYTSSVNWNASTFGIFSNLDNQGKIDAGAFMQAYCYASQDTVKERYREFSERYYRDDESVEMMQLMVKSMKVNVHSFLCAADGTSGNWTVEEGTVRVVFDGVAGKINPATYAAATKSATIAELTTWLKKLEG